MISDNDYYSKYLKYKMKYLHKKMQIGGDINIDIFIRGMPPNKYELNFKVYPSFSDIQNFVLSEKLIPIEKQRIFYMGNQLTAEQLSRNLADLKLHDYYYFVVNSPLHVIVRNKKTDDKNFIEIVDDETFGTLKAKIAEIKRVPVDKIEIHCPKYEFGTGVIAEKSHKVSDDKLLVEYNIISGMIIDYVILA
jgi:hypothetical protein